MSFIPVANITILKHVSNRTIMNYPRRPTGVLDLPQELRDIIWYHVYDESALLGEDGRVSWWKAMRLPRHDRYALVLFRVSKAVGKEAMGVFYANGKFRIMLDCSRQYPISMPPMSAMDKIKNVVFLITGIDHEIIYQRRNQDSDQPNPCKLLGRILLSFSRRKADHVSVSCYENIRNLCELTIKRFGGKTILRKNCRICFEGPCQPDMQTMLNSGLVKSLGMMTGFEEVSVEFPIPLIGNFKEWQEHHRDKAGVERVIAAGEAASKAVKLELETTLGPATIELLDRPDHWAAICRLKFFPRKHTSLVPHGTQELSR